MGGYYFTDKRYFSRGNALLPTEMAAADKSKGKGKTVIVKQSKKSKKKKIVTGSQKVKAKNNKGNINSINLSFGNMGGGGASGGGGGSAGGSGGMSSGGFAPRGPSMDATLTRELIQALRDSRRGAPEDRRDRPQPKPPPDDPRGDGRVPMDIVRPRTPERPVPPQKPSGTRTKRTQPPPLPPLRIKKRDDDGDDGGVVDVDAPDITERNRRARARLGETDLTAGDDRRKPPLPHGGNDGGTPLGPKKGLKGAYRFIDDIPDDVRAAVDDMISKIDDDGLVAVDAPDITERNRRARARLGETDLTADEPEVPADVRAAVDAMVSRVAADNKPKLIGPPPPTLMLNDRNRPAVQPIPRTLPALADGRPMPSPIVRNPTAAVDNVIDKLREPHADAPRITDRSQAGSAIRALSKQPLAIKDGTPKPRASAFVAQPAAAPMSVEPIVEPPLPQPVDRPLSFRVPAPNSATQRAIKDLNKFRFDPANKGIQRSRRATRADVRKLMRTPAQLLDRQPDPKPAPVAPSQPEPKPTPIAAAVPALPPPQSTPPPQAATTIAPEPVPTPPPQSTPPPQAATTIAPEPVLTPSTITNRAVKDARAIVVANQDSVDRRAPPTMAPPESTAIVPSDMSTAIVPFETKRKGVKDVQIN
eukprot:SAG31_NODE_5891_length_2270_cov_57.900046_1_plen_645_part_10